MSYFGENIYWTHATVHSVSYSMRGNDLVQQLILSFADGSQRKTTWPIFKHKDFLISSQKVLILMENTRIVLILPENIENS